MNAKKQFKHWSDSTGLESSTSFLARARSSEQEHELLESEWVDVLDV